jgi:hypothetical protein
MASRAGVVPASRFRSIGEEGAFVEGHPDIVRCAQGTSLNASTLLLMPAIVSWGVARTIP